LDGWEGSVVPDQGEVNAWQYVSVVEIQLGMRVIPEDYTAWFRDELRAVDYFALL